MAHWVRLWLTFEGQICLFWLAIHNLTCENILLSPCIMNNTSWCTEVIHCASGEIHVQTQMPHTEYIIGTASVLRVMISLNCFIVISNFSRTTECLINIFVQYLFANESWLVYSLWFLPEPCFASSSSFHWWCSPSLSLLNQLGQASSPILIIFRVLTESKIYSTL